MPTRRRTLLACCLSLVAGCGSQSTPRPAASEPSPTRSSPPGEREGAGSSPPASGPTVPDDPTGSVTVVNDASHDRYVTVVVERAGEPAFVDSRTVRGGTSHRFEGVGGGSGDYRVVVETANGTRGAFDWAVTDAFDDLRVAVGTEVTFSRVVRCAPDCRSVSLGGSSTGYPEGDFDPRGRRAGSTLRVRNDVSVPRGVRVRVADGAVLDYRYRVPPTTTLEIPVPQRSGETRVVVERSDGGGEATHWWSMETTPTVTATVGATVRVPAASGTAASGSPAPTGTAPHVDSPSR